MQRARRSAEAAARDGGSGTDARNAEGGDFYGGTKVFYRETRGFSMVNYGYNYVSRDFFYDQLWLTMVITLILRTRVILVRVILVIVI